MLPTIASLSRISGSLRISPTSPLSRSMMGRGVPPGAARPSQEMTSKPGSVSAMAGISGSSTKRLREETASPRNMPPLIWANAIVPVSIMTSSRPPNRSCTIWVLPRYGIPRSEVPASIDQLAGQVVHAAGQVHAIGHVEWRGFGAGDEIGEGLERRIRGGRNHHRIAGDQRDEGEILDRMIGQRLGDRGARGKGAGQHADEIAVRLRFCDGVPGRDADCR